MIIENLICLYSNTVLDAMRIMNRNSKGICFIVSKDNTLIGTITDGDIRRSILDGVDLISRVDTIVSKNYIYAKVLDSLDVLYKMTSHKIRVIPIVDEDHKVVDYFEYTQSMHFPIATPSLNGNEFKYLSDAFFSTWISSQGEYLNKFEEGFSQYSDCKYGVAVSNGTVALHLALIALGIGQGDEVIIPDLTFAATINAVLHANATPIIVDIEEDSWCIDPIEIEESITNKTKAIIPVHIYGQVCDMKKIMTIAKRYNLKVIEDCAEAHGAMFNDKKVGSFGDIGCFSFYGNKIITTGEGGMCTTNNTELDRKMRVLRDHGMSKDKRYWHDVVGYNYRMTNLQAAIGLAQVERIEIIHENRRKYENSYKDILNSNAFIFQKDIENRQRITWLVSILIYEKTDREDYLSKLQEIGIDARPFFYPLSDMDIYKQYCKKDTLVTSAISKSGINLPAYESLNNMKKIQYILNKHFNNA